ncbi:MAG: TetR/AcrR family transcriptional regulator [Gammaproteobacteria bacterium]|nr:TetR/AcrR family transcriptional regulator [Gammaproteobacteria bacterium]
MANVLHFDEDSALSQFLDIFWAKGYKATTTRELASRAGISESSLFNCFRSKREIYIKSLCRYHDMTKSRRNVMENEESALTGIRKYWEALAKLVSDPSRSRGCMITNATVEQTDDPEISAYLKTIHKDYEKAFENTLDRAVRQNELKPDTDTRALAQFLASNAQGLRLLSRISPSRTMVHNVVELTMRTLDSYQARD